jgi:hypothetical protein
MDFRRRIGKLVVDFSFSGRLALGWKKIILPSSRCHLSGNRGEVPMRYVLLRFRRFIDQSASTDAMLISAGWLM